MKGSFKEEKTKYSSETEHEEHTIASSNPPPKAMPSIAATEGFLATKESMQYFK